MDSIKGVNMHHLYWVHLSEHSDPFTEGYIGISTQPQIRFRQHTTDIAKRSGSRILRQYVDENGIDDLHHTILSSFNSKEEARNEEKRYRPKTNIGWNIWVGGGVSPDCTGRIDSEETKKQRTESIIKTKSSRSYTSPFKGQTNRHNQETRNLIGSYHKGKSISQEHRKAISEKLSGRKSPKAKPINIKDIETNKVYNFECVLEASKEMRINYSALRSAFRNKQQIIYRKWEILYQGAE